MKNIIKNESFEVNFLSDTKTIICSAIEPYILDEVFKFTFSEISEFVEVNDVQKFVFDKSKLTVFNQESMVWYHVDWKRKMLNFGLKKHYKILPADNIFKFSVEMGKKRIAAENPDFNFNDFDIRYFDTVEEALNA
ncbi:MAG: hypothetical protein JXR68_04965 [Bacteroidales bacterium]|nr:hypothetical protein [Bacteroidales bacterium]